MTSQVNDTFKIEGEAHFLVGLRGIRLYTLSDFGIIPEKPPSNCIRGGEMVYDCVNDELILDGMCIWARKGPTINGVEPSNPYGDKGEGLLQYEGIGLRTNFTGNLILAIDPIVDRPWMIGPWGYPTEFRTVIEIVVEDGLIIEKRDLSTMIHKLRDPMLKALREKIKQDPYFEDYLFNILWNFDGSICSGD